MITDNSFLENIQMESIYIQKFNPVVHKYLFVIFPIFVEYF